MMFPSTPSPSPKAFNKPLQIGALFFYHLGIQIIRIFRSTFVLHLSFKWETKQANTKIMDVFFWICVIGDLGCLKPGGIYMAVLMSVTEFQLKEKFWARFYFGFNA